MKKPDKPKTGKRKPYRRPSISSSEAFYTRALACVKGFTGEQPDCGFSSDPAFS